MPSTSAEIDVWKRDQSICLILRQVQPAVCSAGEASGVPSSAALDNLCRQSRQCPCLGLDNTTGGNQSAGTALACSSCCTNQVQRHLLYCCFQHQLTSGSPWCSSWLCNCISSFSQHYWMGVAELNIGIGISLPTYNPAPCIQLFDTRCARCCLYCRHCMICSWVVLTMRVPWRQPSTQCQQRTLLSPATPQL